MVLRTLPGVGLQGFWTLGATYKTEMDSNLRIVSALLVPRAKSRVTALPGTPSLGDIYIVPAAAGSNANEVAIWDGESGSEAWVYLVPLAGWEFWIIDEAKRYRFDGSSWAEIAAGGGGGSFRSVETESGTTYTAVSGDSAKWKRLSNASAITLTIDAGVHTAGDELVFEQGGAGVVTVSAGAGMTVRSRDGAYDTAGQYAVFAVKFLSASECVITGDLA